MRLADLLIKSRTEGRALGDIELLQRYLAVTGKDQDRTAVFSDYMTRLFSTDNPAAVWARKFGLFSIDLVLPLRRAFAARAMGMADPRVEIASPLGRA